MSNNFTLPSYNYPSRTQEVPKRARNDLCGLTDDLGNLVDQRIINDRPVKKTRITLEHPELKRQRDDFVAPVNDGDLENLLERCIINDRPVKKTKVDLEAFFTQKRNLYALITESTQFALCGSSLNLSKALISIAKAQLKDHCVDESQKTLLLAKESVHKEPVDATLFILKTIAGIQAQIEDIDGAQETLNEIKALFSHREHDTSLLITIALIEAQIGNIPSAIELAHKLQNSRFQSYVFMEIAMIQVNKGDIKRAKKTIALIVADERCVPALIELSLAQLRTLDIDGAKKSLARAETITQYLDIHWKASFLKDIAEVQIKIGDFNGAEINLKLAEDAAHYIKNPSTKFSSLKDIVLLRAQIHDNNTVKEVLVREKGSYFIKGDALRKFGKFQGQIGETVLAKETLSEAKKLAHYIKDPLYKSHILKKIALAQARIEDPDSQETFSEAEEAVQEINDPLTRCSSIIKIALAQAKIGDVDKVKKTLTLNPYN